MSKADMTPNGRLFPTLAVMALPLLASCSTEGRAAARWTGTMDTLPSGEVVVHNTARGVWAGGSEWRAEEVGCCPASEGSGWLRLAAST